MLKVRKKKCKPYLNLWPSKKAEVHSNAGRRPSKVWRLTKKYVEQVGVQALT